MVTKRNMNRRKSKRSFEMVPDGIPAVKIEKRSVDVAAKIRKQIREESPEIAARLTPLEFKFIIELYFGDCGVIQYKAYKAIKRAPDMDDLFAGQSASRIMKRIREKIGEDGIHEIIGYTLEKADRTILALMNAETTREFITREGITAKGGTYPDYQAMGKGVDLFFKRKGIGKENPSGQVLTVNVISHCPPNSEPWPNAVWPRGFPAGTPPPKAIDVSPADVRTNQRDD